MIAPSSSTIATTRIHGLRSGGARAREGAWGGAADARQPAARCCGDGATGREARPGRWRSDAGMHSRVGRRRIGSGIQDRPGCRPDSLRRCAGWRMHDRRMASRRMTSRRMGRWIGPRRLAYPPVRPAGASRVGSLRGGPPSTPGSSRLRSAPPPRRTSSDGRARMGSMRGAGGATAAAVGPRTGAAARRSVRLRHARRRLTQSGGRVVAHARPPRLAAAAPRGRRSSSRKLVDHRLHVLRLHLVGALHEGGDQRLAGDDVDLARNPMREPVDRERRGRREDALGIAAGDGRPGGGCRPVHSSSPSGPRR